MATVEGRISHAPMTGEEKKVIFASSLGTVFEWYDFYLAGSLAVYHQQDVFLRGQPDGRLHLHPARLRGRLRGASVRRDRVRAARRHGRAQVHVPRDDRDHGPVDLRDRLPARLRVDRDRRAGDLHRDAAVAGPGARRRIRRRGDLRRRTRAREQARRVDRVDPDDGHARPVRLAARDPGGAHVDRRRNVRGVGLAHAVHRFDRAARRFRCGSGCNCTSRRCSSA